MKIFAFVLLTIWLSGCGQGLELASEGRVLRSMLSLKPKPANVFLRETLQNNKLMSNINKLDRRIKRYVKRGGNLNAKLDNYGTTILNQALREGKENFAALLINNGAEVNLALRALLAHQTPTTQAWSEISWLIEGGGARGLLDKYVEMLIKGSGISADGMRQAIVLGADKEKAFATAVQEKRAAYLEVLTDFVDDQQTFEQAWQANDYDLVKMLLEARKGGGKEVDGDELLVKAWRDDKEPKFAILAVKFGGSENSIVRKSLQEKDYDTLKLAFKPRTVTTVTWSSLDNTWMLLFDVFQTKDAGVIEALLARHNEKSKKEYLDWMLGRVARVKDYDTAEFIVEQGGDPNIVIANYLGDILHSVKYEQTLENVEFDLPRAWRMVVG